MQWVPKTNSKLVNLSKTYGAAYLGRGPQPTASFIADQLYPGMALWSSSSSSSSSKAAPPAEQQKVQALLRQLRAIRVPFIDLRDPGEAQASPIPDTVNFSPNDLLSGALARILPKDKEARMVVFASNQQRSINGYNALRRQGYANVAVSDTAAVQQAFFSKERQ